MGLEKALPGIGMGMSILGDVANPILQHFQNKSNRRWQEKMMSWQRGDALADWNMINEYNSPAAQMRRFEEAGLNPHLIYGQGSEGNASGVRASAPAGAGGDSPRVDFSGTRSSLMQGFDMEIKDAQKDNLLEMNRNLKLDGDLKEVNIRRAVEATGLTKAQKDSLLFNLGLQTELRDTTVETAKWKLVREKINVNAIQGEIARAWELHPGKLKEQAIDVLNKHKQNAKTGAEILYISKLIERINSDLALRKLDQEMVEKGINPKDPPIWRNIQRILDFIFR